MAVALQTLITRSVNNMGSGIHPAVKDAAIEVITLAYKEGIYVQISSGYRSMTEQAMLYGKGRSGYIYNGVNYSQPEAAVVTNAKPGQSLHNYGLAVDFFIVSNDGRNAVWTVESNWRRAAAIGKGLGFKWGGDWTSFKDYPHLEMTGGLTLSQLQAGKKPNLCPPKTTTPPVLSAPPSKILKFQQRLNNTYHTNIKEDGIYGPATKSSALKAFQQEVNKQYNKKLAVDGIRGSRTRAASPNVQKGARGMITYILQGLLFVYGYDTKGLDGIYGTGTEQAVKAFQAAKKISQDGIAGPDTFEKLFQE